MRLRSALRNHYSGAWMKIARRPRRVGLEKRVLIAILESTLSHDVSVFYVVHDSFERLFAKESRQWPECRIWSTEKHWHDFRHVVNRPSFGFLEGTPLHSTTTDFLSSFSSLHGFASAGSNGFDFIDFLPLSLIAHRFDSGGSDRVNLIIASVSLPIASVRSSMSFVSLSSFSGHVEPQTSQSFSTWWRSWSSRWLSSWSKATSLPFIMSFTVIIIESKQHIAESKGGESENTKWVRVVICQVKWQFGDICQSIKLSND